MTTTLDNPTVEQPQRAGSHVRFGANELRLGLRDWIVTIAIVVACYVWVPGIWKHVEPFATGPDFRIPYALSNDYWLFQRRLEQDMTPGKVALIGDSVIWGEYVRPDGTLSHFLNQQAGQPGRFVNCGINGMFPLAMDGLIADYGQPLRNRKVIVECNVLWMTSPERDLSAEKEQSFNHTELVPQFSPRLPSYRADVNDRLGAVIGRHVGFFQWGQHLQTAYYDQKSIPLWTLKQDSQHPELLPNAWRNPLYPLASGIPAEPAVDPDRGPTSKRHHAWNAGDASTTEFDWVSLDHSLQWAGFRHVIQTLRQRGNDVLVVVGPFNEHMIAPEQRPAYEQMRAAISARLTGDGASVIVPETLPAELYADASHPLTAGYELMARQLYEHPVFRAWYARPDGK